MCGIAGHVATEPGEADLETVRRMCGRLAHRGPDSDGFHEDEGVALGVRRLAIIDVAAGDQPIYNEDRSVCVALNGEIYNFAQLRNDLMARSHTFSTRSDTEVIAHLYEECGTELVHELHGMFAFALWDARRRRLMLARDRVGKKPLYYCHRNGALVFASELAALLEDRRIARRADPQAIDAFLALQYVPHPLSAIEGVRKLEPASVLTWEEGRVSVHRYWRLRFSPKRAMAGAEAADLVRSSLRDAVRRRLVSERPMGAFLSGGIDSAAVVATMAELESEPVKTFSIGFESDRHNELPYARRVAERFGTDHTELVVQPDAAAILPKLVAHYGDPFADASAIPSFYLAQMARRDVVVALNGDGGDEAFGGYNRYLANTLARPLERLPSALRRALGSLTRRLPQPADPMGVNARVQRVAQSLEAAPPARYARQMTYGSSALRDDLYEPEFKERVDPLFLDDLFGAAWEGIEARDRIDRLLGVDIETYLPGDLLVKMDIATMANSLEARSPFLDHVFMENVATLPAHAKIASGTTKVALKTALRGVVPDEILDRKKWGFSVPMAEWLRGPLRTTARDVLLDPRIAERGCMRPRAVAHLLEQHESGRADRSSEVWALLVLELWHRQFIDCESDLTLA